MALSQDKTEVSFLAAGDCGPVHGPKDGVPIERYTELVRPILASVDLRFVNCERQYSTRGALVTDNPHGCQPPAMAQIFTDCGFDVANLANNHMYDFGPDALIDTRALMIEKGLAVMGAGKNLDEAREPAIVERKGIKFGFLGYCSYLPHGIEAGPNKPGVAALRIKTTYEPRGPHLPVRVYTEPNDRDMKMVLQDISLLRKRVDVLMVSMHWGLSWIPRIVADYQVIAARACVDAGADMVIGHGPHVPKAIEVYKGKTIFYSLSNFCMTKTFPSPSWDEDPWTHGALRNHVDQDPDYPLLPYGSHAKRALLAKAIFTKDGVKRVSFLPILIDTQYRPEVLRRDDPRFNDETKYIEWASDGFKHKFVVEGDEIVVT